MIELFPECFAILSLALLYRLPSCYVMRCPSWILDHPNYYSHYMNASNGWPAVHVRVPGLGNDTIEGWRREGWWARTADEWQFGICPPLFNRQCPVRHTFVLKCNQAPLNCTGFVTPFHATRAAYSHFHTRLVLLLLALCA